MQKAEIVLSMLSPKAKTPVRLRLRDGWRAGYIERRTSGSEGGSRKPAVAMQQGGWFLPYKPSDLCNSAS
jgi:hypothetical protein